MVGKFLFLLLKFNHVGFGSDCCNSSVSHPAYRSDRCHLHWHKDSLFGRSYQSCSILFPFSSLHIWNYQHNTLFNRGWLIVCSNLLPNGKISFMESFFHLMKAEMMDEHFENPESLAQAMTEWIEFYNNRRIRTKLKGKSPVQYRELANQLVA